MQAPPAAAPAEIELALPPPAAPDIVPEPQAAAVVPPVTAAIAAPAPSAALLPAQPPERAWQTVTVKRGDTLSDIFERATIDVDSNAVVLLRNRFDDFQKRCLLKLEFRFRVKFLIHTFSNGGRLLALHKQGNLLG